MYIKINRKKYKIVELTKFWDRFKGLKFNLEKLDHIIKFPHKKFVSTDFICQKIDIILTDKDEKILYIYDEFETEKYIFPKRKVYNVYFFPVGLTKHFEIGDTLNIEEDKKKK
ncbi:MAG: hypothetical protein IJ880_02820 [Bacilli bacterium]|nr:hypothetical protein [Bacilli bacterium]